MPTALIIGASRGIGREFVRQLLAGGWQVHATARDDVALADVRAAGAEPLKVDVTLPESLAGLGWQLDGVKLDLAIYVAGIYGPAHQAGSVPSDADFDRVMHTNVLGAMRAIPLVAPLLEVAGGKFVFISSGMGSITETTSSAGWLYRTSKAALNMAVKSASLDYPRVIFTALCPGWVRTDLGGPEATISAEESVRDMLQVIASLKPEDSGSYRKHTGQSLAW